VSSARWLLALSLALVLPAQAGPRRHVQPEPVDPTEQVLIHKRESIRILEDLVRQAEGPRRARMLFRLAELYAQVARTLKIRAFDACAEPAACPEGPDLTEFERDHDRALALYGQVVRAHPRYDRVDEARFALALGLLEREQPDAARQHLRQYVRQHPDGAQAHLAWLQLGELELDARHADAAVIAFRKAAAFEHGEYRATAEHRLGWALKNVGQDREALEALRRAVSLARSAGDEALVEEGRKDLVRFAVELGALDEVEDLLGHGEDRVRALSLAAERHAAQGEVDQAITVWKRVITEAPTHPERPTALAAVTRELRMAGRWAEAVDAAGRLLVDHTVGSPWGRANATQPDRILEARHQADQELRRVAVAAHTEARKLRRRPGGAEAARAAGRAYATWLDAFADDEPQAAAEVHRAYGELLYEQGAWAAAFDHYEAVWTLAPGTPGARQSTVDALHAADRLLEQDPPPEPPTGQALTTAAPRELTEGEERLLRAADAALTEGTDKEAAIVYRSAYLLYRAMHFEEAGERFRRVIALEPTSRDAERAANLIADMLAVRESWEALAENASFYADQEGLGTPAFRQKMAALARKAELKQVEAQLQDDGDRTRAARDLLAWVERHHERADPQVLSLALRDAAAHHEAEADPLAAARVRERFLSQPALHDDPHRQDQLLALGDDHERLARWSDAAHAYGQAVERGGEDPRLVEAAWRRALLLEALEHPDAVPALTAFLDQAAAHPDADSARPERVTDARLRRARLQGTPDAWRPLLADTSVPTSARLQAALALHDLGQTWALERGLQLLPDPVPTELSDLAGALRYQALEPRFQAFSSTRLTALPQGSPAAEKRHMTRELAAMQREAQALEDGYRQVIATRSGRWGLAAAVRLGELQEAWATTLAESPRPHHLTDEQRALYEQDLADAIWMRQEQARLAYTAALERAFDLPLYTSATAHARERLAELDPQAWPPSHERVDVRWRLAGHRAPETFEESL